MSGVSFDALIDHAEAALQSKREEDQDVLKEKLENLDIRLERLVSLLDIRESIDTLNAESQKVNSDLDTILEGISLDELRSRLDEEHVAADTIALKSEILKNAMALICRDETEQVFCPICSTEHLMQDLQSKIQQTITQLSDYETLKQMQRESVKVRLKTG